MAAPQRHLHRQVPVEAKELQHGRVGREEPGLQAAVWGLEWNGMVGGRTTRLWNVNIHRCLVIFS